MPQSCSSAFLNNNSVKTKSHLSSWLKCLSELEQKKRSGQSVLGTPFWNIGLDGKSPRLGRCKPLLLKKRCFVVGQLWLTAQVPPSCSLTFPFPVRCGEKIWKCCEWDSWCVEMKVGNHSLFAITCWMVIQRLNRNAWKMKGFLHEEHVVGKIRNAGTLLMPFFLTEEKN